MERSLLVSSCNRYGSCRKLMTWRSSSKLAWKYAAMHLCRCMIEAFSQMKIPQRYSIWSASTPPTKTNKIPTIRQTTQECLALTPLAWAPMCESKWRTLTSQSRWAKRPLTWTHLWLWKNADKSMNLVYSLLKRESAVHLNPPVSSSSNFSKTTFNSLKSRWIM